MHTSTFQQLDLQLTKESTPKSPTRVGSGKKKDPVDDPQEFCTKLRCLRTKKAL